jgi:hypothetical protein
MVFCQKRRESVRRDNPGLSDAKVEKCLQSQWNDLDEEQRAKFIPMGPDVTSVSDLLLHSGSLSSPDGSKRSGRPRKPTKKKLESDENTKLFQPRVIKKTSEEGLLSIIDSVAQGAGQVWEHCSTDTVPEVSEVEDYQSKKKRKKKSVAEITTEQEDVSSVSESAFEEEEAPRRRRSTLSTPLDPELGDYHIELFKLSGSWPGKKRRHLPSL